MKYPFQQSVAEVAGSYGVDIHTGLRSQQAIDLQNQFGPNALPKPKKESLFQRVYHLIAEPLSLILLGAAAISFALGDLKDGIVITLIVAANAVMGFVQQAKAENALAALERMSDDDATVLRDGQPQRIAAIELVPGDVIILDAGSKVPADARIFESAHMQVVEAALTGESQAVEKITTELTQEQLPIGDRKNMLYKDSIVTYGRGKAIVVSTGKDTEIGKISELLAGQKKGKTQLEIELERVGKVLTGFAAFSAVLVSAVLYFVVDLPLKEVFLTSISVAIAVVPEGIPVVITTVLAISVTKLAKKNAIIRRMSAVETLGAVTRVLTDKTGTLTMNEMRVVHAVLNAEVYTVHESGELFDNAKAKNDSHAQAYTVMLECAVLCNDAELSEDGKHIGDPTETALLVAAEDAGLSVKELRTQYTRIDEIPFSSDTKRMSVMVERISDGKRFVYTKGAPESVMDAGIAEMKPALNSVAGLARKGIRNLAFAMQEVATTEATATIAELTGAQQVLGVLGLKDPLRPEVKTAVEAARKAGIQTVMITGDHMLIAASIGTELGIIQNDSQVMDGSVFGDPTQEELIEILKTVHVFSRVSPEQKLRIVEASQKAGAIVAVTGDGVNDAPAIKRANIGIAMGISGTDVTKEVADMVLRDDNYSTIITAIGQGRVIFSNFVKFLRYQISCNLSGVFIIVGASFISPVAALLPIHILILNLFSETGPSIALGLEKGEKDVMQRAPRSSSERLLDRRRWVEITIEAVLLGIAGIATYVVVLSLSPIAVTTATLTTAFLSRLWHAFNSRSERLSVFSRLVHRNKALELTVLGTIAVYALMVYTPYGNAWFSTVPMSATVLGVAVAFSLVPVFGVELFKMQRRRAATA